MKFPKIALPSVLKKNLKPIAFILIIPLGIVLGYFFSNIQSFLSGGYKNVLTSINKIFYVAKVDGVGVSKSEWEKVLKARYGKAAARELIDTVMINNELKKAKIQVSQEEINAEIAEIEKQLGGQSIEELLKQQGITLKEFRDQVKMRVGVKKLLADKVTVSDAEVAEFAQKYGASIKGSTDEEKLAEARRILINQKMDEEMNKWYNDLQSKVTVENYLEN